MNERTKRALLDEVDGHIADLSRVCERLKGHLYPDSPVPAEQRQLLSKARDNAARAMQMLEALEDSL
jgi:hypothetical protein